MLYKQLGLLLCNDESSLVPARSPLVLNIKAVPREAFLQLRLGKDSELGKETEELPGPDDRIQQDFRADSHVGGADGAGNEQSLRLEHAVHPSNGALLILQKVQDAQPQHDVHGPVLLLQLVHRRSLERHVRNALLLGLLPRDVDHVGRDVGGVDGLHVRRVQEGRAAGAAPYFDDVHVRPEVSAGDLQLLFVAGHVGDGLVGVLLRHAVPELLGGGR
mmetsp:Transcript_25465/g.47429  ORF Transcript_25465/g.47429 Transcript_25465/m.47429 type:complete len:218 (+) Transcript_25465:792-1445(+)